MTTTPSLKNVLVAIAMIAVIAFFMEKAQEDKTDEEFEKLPLEIRCMGVCDCMNGFLCFGSIIIIGGLLIWIGCKDRGKKDVRKE